MIQQCSQCGYLQHNTDQGTCKKCNGSLVSLGESQPPQAPAQFGISLAAENENKEEQVDISGIISAQLLQDPLIGRVVGNFTIVEKLGAGGFGSVYKANHAHRPEPFAIKVLHYNQTQQAYFIERFKREARALSRLSHEHIVQLADFGVLPGSGLYLAMEFVQGRNLGERIDRGEPFSLQRIGHVIEQLCQVMAYIHEKGIVHRDIKPSNIMLVDRQHGQEQVKLIDFGIASNLQEHESLTGTGTLLGTARFMSPEQAMGHKNIGPSSDLYAMAVILFLMLTRRLPVEANSPAAILLRKVRIPPATLQERAPEQQWTPALEAFMARALAIEANDRPKDALHFWAEFEQAIASQDTEATVIAQKPMPFVVGGASAEKAHSTYDNTPTRIEEGLLDVLPDRTPPPSLEHTLATALPSQVIAEVMQAEAIQRQTTLPHPPEHTQQPPAPTGRAWWLWLPSFLLILGLGFLIWPPLSPRPKERPKPPPKQTERPKQPTHRIEPAPTPRKTVQANVGRPNPRRAEAQPTKHPQKRTAVPRTRPRPKRVRSGSKRRRRKKPSTPCRKLPSSHHWTWALLRQPPRPTSALFVRLLGCPGCRKRKVGRGVCLGVPKSVRRVSILVKTDGFQSCIHHLRAGTRKLIWKLKKPGEIMTMRYPCTRTYR